MDAVAGAEPVKVVSAGRGKGDSSRLLKDWADADEDPPGPARPKKAELKSGMDVGVGMEVAGVVAEVEVIAGASDVAGRKEEAEEG